MTEFKSFASLTPSLLARKGAARPAMRPALPQSMPPVGDYHEALARAFPEDAGAHHAPEDDLGWNDMGEGHPDQHSGGHVPQTAAGPEPEAVETALQPQLQPQLQPGPKPQPTAQIVPIAKAQPRAPTPRPQAAAPARRSALADGRRAAFTLRLDSERHLQLRLACTLAGRSAQTLLIEALDQLMADSPEAVRLAAQVRERR